MKAIIDNFYPYCAFRGNFDEATEKLKMVGELPSSLLGVQGQLPNFKLISFVCYGGFLTLVPWMGSGGVGSISWT